MQNARLAIAAASILSFVPLRAQHDDGEFSAHGVNVIRIENEAKLRVPNEIVEDVWSWLRNRYGDCSWLDRDGSKFTATFGDEQFTDVYFDDPELRVLAAQSGVRYRSRIVTEGSAARKDGRQLLQLKLNRGDNAGMARTEIKFEASPENIESDGKGAHAMVGLVKPGQRRQLCARFEELQLNPFAMREVLTVEQNRRRVYVSDQNGAFATITLDMCTCSDYGADVHWTEIELELNEIRYTEAKEDGRARMQAVNDFIQKDLQARFPSILQDQTPKYNKAFAMIEASTWMPMRTMVSLGVSPGEALGGGILLVLAAGVVWFAIKRRRFAPARAA